MLLGPPKFVFRLCDMYIYVRFHESLISSTIKANYAASRRLFFYYYYCCCLPRPPDRTYSSLIIQSNEASRSSTLSLVGAKCVKFNIDEPVYIQAACLRQVKFKFHFLRPNIDDFESRYGQI